MKLLKAEFVSSLDEIAFSNRTKVVWEKEHIWTKPISSESSHDQKSVEQNAEILRQLAELQKQQLDILEALTGR